MWHRTFSTRQIFLYQGRCFRKITQRLVTFMQIVPISCKMLIKLGSNWQKFSELPSWYSSEWCTSRKHLSRFSIMARKWKIQFSYLRIAKIAVGPFNRIVSKVMFLKKWTNLPETSAAPHNSATPNRLVPISSRSVQSFKNYERFNLGALS